MNKKFYENKSLLMVKPKAVKDGNTGIVLQELVKNNFNIVALKKYNLTKEHANFFYDMHRERPFFQDLVDFITSGSIVAVCVQKENCIEDLRKLVGNTDPLLAEEGTIRKKIGTSKTMNAVHASDSIQNARLEINFFFSVIELIH